MITYFLKDEAPKSTVYLYSINNSNTVDIAEGADDADKTNAETKQYNTGLAVLKYYYELKKLNGSLVAS